MRIEQQHGGEICHTQFRDQRLALVSHRPSKMALSHKASGDFGFVKRHCQKVRFRMFRGTGVARRQFFDATYAVGKKEIHQRQFPGELSRRGALVIHGGQMEVWKRLASMDREAIVRARDRLQRERDGFFSGSIAGVKTATTLDRLGERVGVNQCARET